MVKEIFDTVLQHEHERCVNCVHFDGYDVCMHKQNFGSIVEDRVWRCLNKKLYKANG